jgi:hypothetical protein
VRDPFNKAASPEATGRHEGIDGTKAATKALSSFFSPFDLAASRDSGGTED